MSGCPVAMILIQELLPYLIVATLTPIFLFGYCCYRLFRKKRLVLPAPFQLPVVGCLPFISRDGVHLTFTKWANKFGKIFACRLGPQRCIVLSDADLVREALAKNVCNDRPEMYLLNIGRIPSEPESRGIIMNYGESWKQQRRFVLNTFRDFGIGKTSFEDVIAGEYEQLVKHIAAENGQPFDIRMLLNSHVANVISTVLFGKDFEHTDTDFTKFVDYVANASENLGGSAVMNFFPWARFLPYFRDIHAHLMAGLTFNFGVLRKLVNNEKKTFNEHGDIRNYTAAFLAKQKSEDGRLFTDHHLVMSLSDIFSAGFETIASTLRWAILYMCLHPEIQTRIQNEIDQAVEDRRPIRLSDRERLPWTEATLLEVQRIASIAPLGMPHATSEETVLSGYVIPRKTIVFTNLYAIHHDPKNFDEPEHFNPERFLDKSQKNIVETENLMPFSTGKRFCPGEALAKMELSLFFSTLLQHFRFKFPDGYSGDLTPRCGITIDTRRYPVIAILRK